MKKMVLIDPSHMLLSTSPVPDLKSEKILNLDADIKQILDTTSLNAHDKALAYEQALHKYLSRVGSMNTPNTLTKPQTPISPVSSDTEKMKQLENRIVESLPKTLQKKGEILLRYIEDVPDLNWNDKGELIIKDQVVNGSHVSDLVHEILRSRKLGVEPKGWSEFSDALKKSNIPRDLIGNKERWGLQQEKIQEKTHPTKPKNRLEFRSPPRKLLKRKAKEDFTLQRQHWEGYGK